MKTKKTNFVRFSKRPRKDGTYSAFFNLPKKLTDRVFHTALNSNILTKKDLDFQATNRKKGYTVKDAYIAAYLLKILVEFIQNEEKTNS